jgi:hypothetical protein
MKEDLSTDRIVASITSRDREERIFEKEDVELVAMNSWVYHQHFNYQDGTS